MTSLQNTYRLAKTPFYILRKGNTGNVFLTLRIYQVVIQMLLEIRVTKLLSQARVDYRGGLRKMKIEAVTWVPGDVT